MGSLASKLERFFHPILQLTSITPDLELHHWRNISFSKPLIVVSNVAMQPI